MVMETLQDYIDTASRELTAIQRDGTILYRHGTRNGEKMTFVLHANDTMKEINRNSHVVSYAAWEKATKASIDDEIERRREFNAAYQDKLDELRLRFREDYRASLELNSTISIPDVLPVPSRRVMEWDEYKVAKDKYEASMEAAHIARKKAFEPNIQNVSAADIHLYGAWREYDLTVDDMPVWYDSDSPRRIGYVNFVMQDDGNIPGDLLQIEANSVVRARRLSASELRVSVETYIHSWDNGLPRYHMTIHRADSSSWDGLGVELSWKSGFDDDGMSDGIYRPVFEVGTASLRVNTLGEIQEQLSMMKIANRMARAWVGRQSINCNEHKD